MSTQQKLTTTNVEFILFMYTSWVIPRTGVYNENELTYVCYTRVRSYGRVVIHVHVLFILLLFVHIPI